MAKREPEEQPKIRKVRSAAERTGSRGKRLTAAERRARDEAKAQMEAEGITAKPISRRHAQRLRKEGRSPGRRCGGFNIAGKPCGSSPLRPGTEIDGVAASGDWCLYHDPDIPADAWKRFFQEKGTQAVRQKPRQLPAMELLAQAIAKTPEILFKAHFESLGYEWDADTQELRKLPDDEGGLGETHVGFSREGVARRSKIKNLTGQRAAARELRESIFGKPRQAMELTGTGSGSSVRVDMTHDRVSQVAQVLRDAGALPGVGPAGDLVPNEED